MSDDNPKPPDGRLRSFNLGNLLMMNAGVTANQLHDALLYQEDHPDQPIGEILISLGHLTEGALQAALDKQSSWRLNGPSSEDVMEMADYACANNEQINAQLKALEQDLKKIKK